MYAYYNGVKSHEKSRENYGKVVFYMSLTMGKDRHCNEIITPVFEF
jgi:hypothetical protein